MNKGDAVCMKIGPCLGKHGPVSLNISINKLPVDIRTELVDILYELNWFKNNEYKNPSLPNDTSELEFSFLGKRASFNGYEGESVWKKLSDWIYRCMIWQHGNGNVMY